MKLFKLTPLAVVLITPILALAQNTTNQTGQWDGYIAGAVGINGYGGDYTNQTNGYGLKNTGFTGDARASAAYTDKSGFGAQIDLAYTESVLSASGIYGYSQRIGASATDAAAHLFYRTDKYLVGLYGQRTAFSNTYTSNNGSSQWSNGYSPSRAYFLGGEGQYYFDRATMYAQVGYQNYGYTYQDTGPAYNYNRSSPAGLTASISGRYFISDNWKLDASYSYGRTTWTANDSNGNTNYSWGSNQNSNLISVGTEYRLENSPISFFGRYTYGNSTSSYTDSNANASNFNLMSNTFLVGIKFTFGTGTLFEQDRKGVTLDPVKSQLLLVNYLN